MAVLSDASQRASAPPSWWAVMERQQQRQRAYSTIQGRRWLVYTLVQDRRWQLVTEREERRLQGIADTEEADQEFEEQLLALDEHAAKALAYLDELSQELGQWSAIDSDALPKAITDLDGELPWQLSIIGQPGIDLPIWDEISDQYEEIAFKPAAPTFDVLILHAQREGGKRATTLDRLRSGRLPFPVITFPVMAQQHGEPKQRGIITLTHAQHAPPRASTASITDRLEVAAA
jgi:hypothetical protein